MSEGYYFNIPIIYRLNKKKEWEHSYTHLIDYSTVSFYVKDVNIIKDVKIDICIQYPLGNLDNFHILKGIVISSDIKDFENKKINIIQVKFILLEKESIEYLKQAIEKCDKYQQKLNFLKNNNDYKILYIEDNKSLLKLFTLLSKEYGFSAYTASSLDESIEVLENKSPNIILTDIHMPDVNIFNLITNIKTNPKYKHIPIIGCSVTYPETGSKFLLLGGNKFITEKPCDFEKLNMILQGIAPSLKDEGFPIL